MPWNKSLHPLTLYRTTIDATGPLNDDKSVLYRMNMAYQSNDSFRESIEGERWFIAPVLTWKATEQGEITFELDYLGTNNVPDMGNTAIGNRPANIPRERNLGEDGAKSDGESVLFGYNWKHAFNHNWKLNNRFNVEYTQQDDQMNVLPWGVLPDGNFTPGGATANGDLQRWVFGLNNNRTHSYNTDLNLAGHFDTYGIGHTVLMRGDYYDFWNAGDQYDSSMVNPCDSNLSLSGFPGINVYYPVDSSCGDMAWFKPSLNGFVPENGSNYEINQKNYGLYLQDQLKLPYDVFLLAGMRYDWTEVNNFDHPKNRS